MSEAPWDQWRARMLAHSGWTTESINAEEYARFGAMSGHTYGGTEACPPCTEQATIACACIRAVGFRPSFGPARQ